MNARAATLCCLLGASLYTRVAAAQQPAPPAQTNPQVAPPTPAGAPNVATIQLEGQQGRWVDTGDSGWIWVPEGATTYDIDGVPYTYLYTPLYGWTWYASPWGWGPYYYGAWVGHPWPFGFAAWGFGAGGWGWRGGYWRGGHYYAGGWHAGGGHGLPAGRFAGRGGGGFRGGGGGGHGGRR